MSASAGTGHIRCAEALVQAAATSRLPIRVEHHDCLDFTSKLFKRLYGGVYLGLVNRTPELWGYFYGRLSKQPRRRNFLMEFFDHFNYRQYISFLQSSQADAVISTHFLPYTSISSELLRGNIKIPFFAATTDFDVHRYWVDPMVRQYFVFHRESAWQLQSKGVEPHRISVTGIPVMKEFGVRGNKQSIRTSLGMKKNAFTVLVLSGGFGVGRVHDILQRTTNALAGNPEKEFNLLIVCGRNEALRMEMERVQFPANITTRVFGFVNNIYDLMDASDVLISKSGGLTSAEAMAKGLPMIIVDPIPGQESKNALIIVEQGAGWQALDYDNLQYKLDRVIKNPDLLAAARKAAARLGKPHAARDIIHEVYSSITEWSTQ